MKGVAHVLAKMDAGEKGFSSDEWRAAMQEVIALGWRRNDQRPEPAPKYTMNYAARTRGYILPWWTDPETGEDVRGYKAMFRTVLERYEAERAVPPPPPSEAALRVLEALEKKPELAAELATLLAARAG